MFKRDSFFARYNMQREKGRVAGPRFITVAPGVNKKTNQLQRVVEVIDIWKVVQGFVHWRLAVIAQKLEPLPIPDVITPITP